MAKRILQIILAILVFSQSTVLAAHGHAPDDRGGERSHHCFVCDQHTTKDVAPTPGTEACGGFSQTTRIATLVPLAFVEPKFLAPAAPRAPPAPNSR